MRAPLPSRSGVAFHGRTPPPTSLCLVRAPGSPSLSWVRRRGASPAKFVAGVLVVLPFETKSATVKRASFLVTSPSELCFCLNGTTRWGVWALPRPCILIVSRRSRAGPKLVLPKCTKAHLISSPSSSRHPPGPSHYPTCGRWPRCGWEPAARAGTPKALPLPFPRQTRCSTRRAISAPVP